MAFGTERLWRAVETLTENVTKLGDSIRDGITDSRNLTLDAVTSARGQLANSIDSTRGDLSNRIDATCGTINNLTRDLAAARREIADLHALIQTWRAEAAEARTSTPQELEPAGPAVEDQPAPDVPQPHSTATESDSPPRDCQAGEEKHQELMIAAAGISRAEFICHRDLWAFFLKKAGNEPHFHVPNQIAEQDGKVHTTLSGPTLLAALTAMWEVRGQAWRSRPPSGDWALSHELYGAVADAVSAVYGKPRPRDKQKVAIVIDRQPGDGADEQ